MAEAGIAFRSHADLGENEWIELPRTGRARTFLGKIGVVTIPGVILLCEGDTPAKLAKHLKYYSMKLQFELAADAEATADHKK